MVADKSPSPVRTPHALAPVVPYGGDEWPRAVATCDDGAGPPGLSPRPNG